MKMKFLCVCVAAQIATALIGCSSAPQLSSNNSSKTMTGTLVAPVQQYVKSEKAEVRLAPSRDARITNRVYHSQAVDVYEMKNGWARVSKFYNETNEGKSQKVALWIWADSLSFERIAAAKKMTLPQDPRITYLPCVAKNGLSERDVLILHAAAYYYLESGKTKRIEDGDKSISRAGVYFLNFGDLRNTFFRPSDIPDLERRIRKLKV